MFKAPRLGNYSTSREGEEIFVGPRMKRPTSVLPEADEDVRAENLRAYRLTEEVLGSVVVAKYSCAKSRSFGAPEPLTTGALYARAESAVRIRCFCLISIHENKCLRCSSRV